jgi:hypothetical protein
LYFFSDVLLYANVSNQIQKRNRMKKTILFLIISFSSNYLFSQEVDLKIAPDEITIPIGTIIKLSTNTDGSEIGNFELLEKSLIEDPVDMMELMGSYERQEIVSNEIEFKFSQADFMGSKMIILTTVHHLEVAFIFDAKIRIRGRTDFIETSITPKHPNVFSVEQWRDDIDYIILSNFRVIN